MINGGKGEAMANAEDEILTLDEVAAYLKVSESTLSRWRSAQTGPPFLRLGGIARYRLDALDQWLASMEDDHAAQG